MNLYRYGSYQILLFGPVREGLGIGGHQMQVFGPAQEGLGPGIATRCPVRSGRVWALAATRYRCPDRSGRIWTVVATRCWCSVQSGRFWALAAARSDAGVRSSPGGLWPWYGHLVSGRVWKGRDVGGHQIQVSSQVRSGTPPSAPLRLLRHSA